MALYPRFFTKNINPEARNEKIEEIPE